MSERFPEAYRDNEGGEFLPWTIDSPDGTVVTARVRALRLEGHERTKDRIVPHLAKHVLVGAIDAYEADPAAILDTIAAVWPFLWAVVDLEMFKESQGRRVVYLLEHREVGAVWPLTRLRVIASDQTFGSRPVRVVHTLFSEARRGALASDLDAVLWRAPELDGVTDEGILAAVHDKGANTASATPSRPSLRVATHKPYRLAIRTTSEGTFAHYAIAKSVGGVTMAFVERLSDGCADPRAEAERLAEARAAAFREKLGIA